uniref:Uncharacterized protein n=1 Tax=Oryza glumipatula TaxID=40148 RepID=A0A0D9Z7F3_9ORYZ
MPPLPERRGEERGALTLVRWPRVSRSWTLSAKMLCTRRTPWGSSSPVARLVKSSAFMRYNCTVS